MNISTVAHLLDHSARRFPLKTAMEIKRGFRYERFSYSLLSQRVDVTAVWLMAQGLRQGDRIALWAPNSPEWVMVFIAALKVGIVVVPVDWRTSQETVNGFFNQTKPKLIFTSVYMGDLKALKTKSIALEHLESLTGTKKPDKPKWPTIHPKDTAEIVFTSGTTGHPKGVVLSHGNLMANLTSLLQAFPGNERYRFLSILPLSHMLEQMVGLLAVIRVGATVTYLPKINSLTIAKTIRKSQITGMVLVPQVLSILLHKIRLQAQEKGQLASFERLLSIAAWIPFRFLRRLLFRPIHQAFGGKLDFVACGGAPLDQKVESVWNCMGVSILQGYGATEGSSVMTTNTLKAHRANSVGKPLPGLEFRLGDNNELWVKGKSIMQGYFNNQAATDQVMENGWYKTGDCGYFDQDGYLYLNGRIKFMIVLQDGKKVFPEDVERKLLAHPLVTECVVIGQKTEAGEVVHAVLTPMKPGQVKKIIQEVNQTLEAHQQILSYSLYSQAELPRTHSLKVDRAKIIAWLAHQNSVYNSDSDPITQDKLYQILADISGVPQAKIHEDTDLQLDLKFNSLRRVELLAQIELEYGVSIDETIMLQTVTVTKLRRLIKQGKTAVKESQLPHWPLHPLWVALRSLFQQAFVFPLLRFFCQPSLTGKEHLTKLKQPVLVVFNHESHLDAPLVLSAIPRQLRQKLVMGAAADYWFTSRLKATLIRGLFNAIPIERTGSVKNIFEWMGELVDEGYSIALSPEGTRSTTGQLNRFKQGAGAAAVLLRLPVIPIYLKGTGKILPKGSSWPKKGKVTIEIGKPLTFPPQSDPIRATQEIEHFYQKEKDI